MFSFKKTSALIILLGCTSAIEAHAHPLKEVCRYTPLPNSEAPLLSASCPLGQGLWGEASPKHSDSYFWIQCGVYPSPVKTEHVVPLLKELNQPVGNKKSPSGYHCLIGPYRDYLYALKGLQQAKKVKHFKNSALREIDLSTLNMLESTAVHIQRQFKTPSYRVFVPFIMSHSEGQYREKNEQWSRMTYQDAHRLCQEKKLSLPNESFWKEANSSDVFNVYGLPSSVPYWGDNKQAFFASGSKVASTEQSLLNVLCVSYIAQNEVEK